MIKTFTQTDLIRYIYHETTNAETKEIDKALLVDSDLMNQYRELSNQMQELSNATLEPAPSTVLNILAYSRSLVKKPQS